MTGPPVVQDECVEDVLYWVSMSQTTVLRVLDLMEATLRHPFAGIGKPEHLKHSGGKVWSRRINESDRLLYDGFKTRVDFLQARYHYG